MGYGSLSGSTGLNLAPSRAHETASPGTGLASVVSHCKPTRRRVYRDHSAAPPFRTPTTRLGVTDVIARGGVSQRVPVALGILFVAHLDG
jgi:hypothetical protein